MQERDEDELIRRCLTGDSAAWSALLRLHHDVLFSIAYRITLNAEDAEDAVQDSWVRIAKGLPRFDRRSSFRTWATSILVRQSLTRVKARRVHLPMEETEKIADPRSPQPSTEEEIELRAALSALPVEERTAVVLHYAEGYTFREIAESLGIPLRTAADHAYRGLRQLRQRMAPEAHR